MKIVNLKNPVMESWLREQGFRLDAPPFLSGAIEARKLLEQLPVKKEPLILLTQGDLGIFHAGRVKRNWVIEPEYGIPFLSSTDILQADLSHLSLISKQVVTENPQLTIHKDWILITRSGSIGRMAYARPDMDGLACSEDVLRVVPEPNRILPGYLYAFLNSKFGVPLVVGGTYGAIIQHIEPHHIANLPVPRLSEEIEIRVHELVQEAAEARTRASALLAKSQSLLLAKLKMPHPQPAWSYQRPLVSGCSAQNFRGRGDAFYYSPINRDAREAFDRAECEQLASLGKVAAVFIPGIFKRLYAIDPAYGYPYITGADVFQLSPTSDKYLLKQVAEGQRLILQKGMIVIQEAGQLGGLIGRSVPVGRYLNGFACTNNMVRVVPNYESDTGYLFAVLSSEYGVRLIAREAAGSSIPHLEQGRVAAIEIPWPNKDIRYEIGKLALEARDLRDEANDKESIARKIIEVAIEEAV
jgi:type I restriction enzyme S subunit